MTKKMLLTCGLSATLLSADATSKPQSQTAPTTAAVPVAGSPGSRLIDYGERDIVTIGTRLRYTTMIVLPKTEQILDFVVGDKEFWIVNGVNNFCFVKPAKAGSQTNLNLITASGAVYSFMLSESGSVAPDVKVFIQAADTSLVSKISGEPKFVPASVAKDFERQWEAAKQTARNADEAADLKVREAEAKVKTAELKAHEAYPATLKFGYRFKKEEPFAVSEIYRDDRFTYIRASPRETPAVYEVKDGGPSVINFEFHDGLFTLDKIVKNGYLAIGKKKLPFLLAEEKQ